MNNDISQAILSEIRKANSILLHCHPKPDPDSVGSVLAMKYALEQLGKRVTAIKGDSQIPEAFNHFPGMGEIVQKNFFEINLADFDLFIILDSGSPDMISRLQPISFPLPLKTIVIDHHASNKSYGDINLVDPTYPANCLILADLFMDWDIKLDEKIAPNLFIGAYTDTGGFKFEGVKPETFATVGELAKYIPSIPRLISQMENSTTPGFLMFEALALNSIKTYESGVLALASVSYAEIKENDLHDEDIEVSRISSFLRTVPEWSVVGCMIEAPAGVTKISFRSADSTKYDVSKLAVALGGGGHKAAAGAVVNLPLSEAIKKVVETAKVLYNL